MDLISVIIPYYKNKNFIKQTVNSVINQTYTKIEIIIVYDNGTFDELNYIKKIKDKDSRIKLIINKKNIGAGKSRNKAIKISKGSFIAFLDADDIWKKKKLEIQLNVMKKNNYHVTHTSYKILNTNNKIIGQRHARNFKSIDSLIKSCDIGLSTVVIKKSIIKENNNFSKIKTKEDFVFWLKLLSRNINIYGIDVCLVKWRKLNNSLSSSKVQKIKDGFTVYNKYLKMNIIKSIYYLFLLSVNSIVKKIN